MQPATTSAILDAIAKHWTIAADAEITLEANPGSVEAGRFAGYRAAGVNRVSIGVQSLRDGPLKALGRLHSVEEARAALAIARGTFERMSFDLIYARPDQTATEWRDELAEALDLAGDHLSLYQLTIEPETTFAALHEAGKLRVPDGDLAHDLYAITQELTERRGLHAYEVSNHARPGAESRHNLLYWRYGGYAGFGPGAHGRLLIGGQRFATETERRPEAWAEHVFTHGHGRSAMVVLTAREEAEEALLMGLRLSEGFDLTRLVDLAGLRVKPDQIDELVRLGLVEPLAASRIRATPSGRLVLNRVVLVLSNALESTPRSHES
jgi:oxygen-independent coproporphyrinogen-3 oxidase